MPLKQLGLLKVGMVVAPVKSYSVTPVQEANAPAPKLERLVPNTNLVTPFIEWNAKSPMVVRVLGNVIMPS